jgi:hypothetical protein
MSKMVLPEYFCWTRFGTEAAQPIEYIFARKEEERVANGGIFLWGVGNAIAPSIKELLRREQRPEILFSPIKSVPRPEDVSPTAIVAWTKGEALDGSAFSLPEHSLVTSRFDPVAMKTAHYALVCCSSTALTVRDSGETIAFDALRNVLTGRPIGASQVTAVVRCAEFDSSTGKTYNVSLRAQLVQPYFLRLRVPVELPAFQYSREWLRDAFETIRDQRAPIPSQLPLPTGIRS